MYMIDTVRLTPVSLSLKYDWPKTIQLFILNRHPSGVRRPLPHEQHLARSTLKTPATLIQIY